MRRTYLLHVEYSDDATKREREEIMQSIKSAIRVAGIQHNKFARALVPKVEIVTGNVSGLPVLYSEERI